MNLFTCGHFDISVECRRKTGFDCARGRRVPSYFSINYFLVAGGGQHVRMCSPGSVHHSIWQRYVSNAAV